MVTPWPPAAFLCRCPKKRLPMPRNCSIRRRPLRKAIRPKTGRAVSLHISWGQCVIQRSDKRRGIGPAYGVPTLAGKMRKPLPKLKSLLPPGELTLDPAVLPQYGGDKWFASHAPDAVALPRSTESVSRVLRFANRHKIPVTPRG